MWTLDQKYSFYRKIAFLMLFTFSFELFFPTVALALTGGPSQPEFSSFEPVATTNMVNEFSGDFTYNLPLINIPGANGGGYPLSLSYHSGGSPEEESSWVGYGWTLNPGAINRSKRGFPDDFNKQKVKYWNKVPANQTTTVGGDVSIEGWSMDAPIGLNASLRYNNYKGFGLTFGAGIQFAKGVVSLGYSVSDGQGSFSVKVNPVAALGKEADDAKTKDEKKFANKAWRKKTKEERNVARSAKRAKQKEASKKSNKKEASSGIGSFALLGSSYGIFSYGSAIRAAKATQYFGGSFNISTSLMGTITSLQVGPTAGISGSYTFQKNKKEDEVDVFGYMYASKAAQSGSNTMMDYYTEKLNPYDKQDRYLGIPFSNADNFSISGEAIGGGFRMHNKKAGHYRPNSVSSHIVIANVGFEAEAGLDIGGGGRAGTGFQKLTVDTWKSLTAFADSSSDDEPIFFRFNNDPGGKIDFANENAQQATMMATSGEPGFKQFDPSIIGITTSMNGGDRSLRSSYIAYHTNAEMDRIINSKNYNRYAVDPEIDKNITRSTVKDGLGEFAIFNEDGSRYVYGLPVYSKKEKNLQFDLEGVPGNDIDSNFVAYRDISDIKKLSSKIGEEMDDAYATSFLLTEITSPDYVDRTWDGPTDDDFGGFTRFSYNRVHGHNDKNHTAAWYRWRIPYNGLLYNRGELSTQRDDMGSLISGEKEIYYLDTIETKTHYAVFEVLDRNDGFEAADNDLAAKTRGQKGSKKLKYLSRIELYAKNNGAPSLIKTVRFDYDYSLNKNLPNADPSTGKLTLTKVWFEYDGIYNAKISPYVFEYEYPSTNYPDKYDALENYGSGLIENPDYSFFSLDPWGNYQRKGGERFAKLRSWVNQNPENAFDPAAWQLKVIKLPTQGEIHVQYEQDDYSFVQDNAALGMVSLKSTSSDFTGQIYFLNTADIGVTTTAEKSALVDKINAMYMNGRKKIYFKFLYGLIGLNPDISRCTSEYITGYCNVKFARLDNAGEVYIKLGSEKYFGNHDLPRKVCIDYTKTQRLGSLNLSGNCDADAVGVGSNSDPLVIVGSLLAYLGTKIVPGTDELCAAVNFDLSYLRVPLLKAKKGGGLRVKRLLMYDNGMETGDEVLYGSEYTYTMANPNDTTETISSGVATNEPASIREENALVEFDEKFKQDFWSKVVAGRDKEQAEKPLGESILPGPSVGYAKVTIENIHSGVTNTGFAVKEYFTARDYPMQESHTALDTKIDFLPLPGGFINYFVNNLWMTQGFKFTLNSMHGQPKRDATYAGAPNDIANARLSTLQEFTYFQPGEKIPVMGSLNAITLDDMGKETEVIFESRKTRDESNDLAIEFDTDVGICIVPIPQYSIMPSFTRTVSKLSSHVTTKVVRYPAIQKSVKTYADGIYHLSENLAFNKQTGQPVLTRTTDGYNDLNLQQSSKHEGTYMTYTFPASSEYKSMGQKARNERYVAWSNSNVTITKDINGSNEHSLIFTTAPGFGMCDVVNSLFPGDFIQLRLNVIPFTDYGVYHVSDSIDGNNLYLLPTDAFATNLLGSSDEVSIEVLRSGRTNQLNTTVGSFTSYGDTTTFSNISSAELAARKAFAAQLDATAPSGIIVSSDISPLLHYVNPFTGNCDNMQDSLSPSQAILFIDNSDPAPNSTFDLQFWNINDESVYNCKGMKEGGHFALDPETQDLVYYDPSNSCFGIPICLNFCPDPITTTNVVQADAQTFDDKWAYNANIYDKISGSNSYENGSRGKWRLESNYVFLDTIKGANEGTERNYNNAGTFPLQLFNWAKESSNNPNFWLKLNSVTQYSPNGNDLEEQDILGIFSTAKFGYDKTVPYLVAKNAEYQAVQFESFEKTYKDSTELEDGLEPGSMTRRTTDFAHSGNASWTLPGTVGLEKLTFNSLTLTQQMLDEGISMKVWIRDTSDINDNAATAHLRDALSQTQPIMKVEFEKIARTGEWALYEAQMTNIQSYFSLGDVVAPIVESNYTPTIGGDIWIDDFRVQPMDAQMVTYVYDTETLRLITSFDDQHFGLYYVYNAEGKLVRKLIETEKGIKTITETLYHTPTVQR